MRDLVSDMGVPNSCWEQVNLNPSRAEGYKYFQDRWECGSGCKYSTQYNEILG